jgi:hypothetical protein
MCKTAGLDIVDNPRGRNKFARKHTTIIYVCHCDTLNKNCTFRVGLSVLVQDSCKLHGIEL